MLFDPEKRVTLSTDILHENVDYTPYQGLTLTGYPVKTYLRGQLIVENGKFMGEKPQGQYFPRAI